VMYLKRLDKSFWRNAK